MVGDGLELVHLIIIIAQIYIGVKTVITGEFKGGAVSELVIGVGEAELSKSDLLGKVFVLNPDDSAQSIILIKIDRILGITVQTV